MDRQIQNVRTLKTNSQATNQPTRYLSAVTYFIQQLVSRCFLSVDSTWGTQAIGRNQEGEKRDRKRENVCQGECI